MTGREPETGGSAEQPLGEAIELVVGGRVVRRISAEQERLTLELYKAEEKLEAIEEATGLTRGTIYWVLKKNDIVPARQRRRSTSPQNLGEPADWALNVILGQQEEIGRLRTLLDVYKRALREQGVDLTVLESAERPERRRTDT